MHINKHTDIYDSPSDIVGIQADQMAQAVRQEDGAHVGREDLLHRAVLQDADLQQGLDHLQGGHLERWKGLR